MPGNGTGGVGTRVTSDYLLREQDSWRDVDLLMVATKRGLTMNKDRIEGSVEQAKGKMKEVAGKATGDAKLETEGKAQKTAGKIQNTIGGIKDTVKEAVDD